jgi:hypothetical protein
MGEAAEFLSLQGSQILPSPDLFRPTITSVSPYPHSTIPSGWLWFPSGSILF